MKIFSTLIKKKQKKDCFLAYYVYKLIPLMKVSHCMRIINILNWLGIRHSICTKNTDSLNLKGILMSHEFY